MMVAKRTRRRMGNRVNQNNPYGATFSRFSGSYGLNRFEVHVNAPNQTTNNNFCGAGARHLYASCLDTDYVLQQPLPAAIQSRRESAISFQSVENRWAVLILSVVLVVMLIVTGCNWSANRGVNHNVSNVQREIRSAEAQNKLLTEKKTAAEQQINVSYEAARQGMVSSSQIASVTLTLAPAGRNSREEMNNASETGADAADTAALAMVAK